MDRRELSALAAQTGAVYERNAEAFVQTRPQQLREAPWLHRFCGLQPEGSDILDLGCGNGAPIARHLMAAGHRVTGVDASAKMIALAQAELPSGDWQLGDMRALDLGRRFHGILGWNSFFHLTPEEQRRCLPNLCQHLLPGGALMLTVGPRAGEVVGQVGADPVYHASLAPEEYRALLTAQGCHILDFVAEDPACYHMTILLAQKAA